MDDDVQIYGIASRPSKPTYSGPDEHGSSYPYADNANKPTTVYESSQTWNYDRPVYTSRPPFYHPLQLDYPQDEYDAVYPDVSGTHTLNQDVPNSVDYAKYRGNPHQVAQKKLAKKHLAPTCLSLSHSLTHSLTLSLSHSLCLRSPLYVILTCNDTYYTSTYMYRAVVLAKNSEK